MIFSSRRSATGEKIGKERAVGLVDKMYLCKDFFDLEEQSREIEYSAASGLSQQNSSNSQNPVSISRSVSAELRIFRKIFAMESMAIPDEAIIVKSSRKLNRVTSGKKKETKHFYDICFLTEKISKGFARAISSDAPGITGTL
jgi:hypothetical protein